MKVLLLTRTPSANLLTKKVFDCLSKELGILLPYKGEDSLWHFATVESHCLDVALGENGPLLKVACVLHRRYHPTFASHVTTLVGSALQLMADSTLPCAKFLRSVGEADVAVLQPTEEWVRFVANVSLNDPPLEIPAEIWSHYSLAAQAATA